MHYNFIGSESKPNASAPRADCEIKQKDLPCLASYFDDVELYLDAMELDDHEKTDVRIVVHANCTRVGMKKCLEYWQRRNPSAATFGALLDILQRLKKGSIARKVFEYSATEI